MLKQAYIKYPMSVYIQINIIEKDIDTCALIDTDSEITIMKSFFIKLMETERKIKNHWNNRR